MSFARSAIQSFVLTIFDLAFIIVGYGAWYTLRTGSQIMVQGTIAAILIIASFVIWNRSLDEFGFERWGLHRPSELISTYLGAFLWFPVLFIPIHFLATGGFTSAGNITATWQFQAVVNLIAVTAIALFGTRRKRVAIPM